MRLLFLGIISGWHEVLAHKLRSFLTLFGIVLGAAALVGMLGVVKGLLRGWEAMIYETGGIERISVQVKRPPDVQREKAALSPGRTLNDVDAILAAVPLAQRVTAEVTIAGGSRLYFQGRATSQYVRGVLPASFVMDRFDVESGRLIGELDNELQTQVVVLGATVAETLIPRGLDPIGQNITINGQPFTVVGVLKEYQFAMGGGRYNTKNSAVFIPLTTCQTLFRLDENVDVLNVQLADIADMPHALEQITNVLHQTHRGIQDTRLETREDLLQRFEETRKSYVYSLGGVAGIGLVVGGIGIMNVMLASISERVREIGVRRALGAKRTDILVQILAESLTIAVAGGIVGMVASMGLIAILQKVVVASNRPELSPAALVIGVVFSGLIGVLAGLYPAIRASRLSPVEALRTN
ncbi:MAG: ABC transporter permease [Opitutaceae bacterium]|jgi:putative ABC transport system permease protein|nr:ABC transporter permease [Opitutaceae bacterium]